MSGIEQWGQKELLFTGEKNNEKTIRNEGVSVVQTQGRCLAGSHCLLFYYELPL